MPKQYGPEALARHVFTLILIGISTEIAVMVYLGFLS